MPDRRPDPSRFRRRRLRALGLVAALAALAGAIVGAGAGGSDPRAAPTAYCERRGAEGMLRAAGQGVMVRMEDRVTPELLRAVRAGEIGGVILFPAADARGERLAAELDRLRRAAAAGGVPAPLVAIDQEGGAVERLPALAPQLSPYTLAQNDDVRGARLEGAATGFQLRELGIDVNLAPVLDVPASPDQFMTPRAFGTSPEQVTRLGLAFATALQREAVAATAKHFPGLGRATENTDFAPTTIDATRAALRSDLRPFRAASAAGVRLVMVGLASYPALGDRAPAALAPPVVRGVLRDELGFEGVIVTDDLLAPAVATTYPPREAAVLAAGAGADLLLFAARDVDGVARSLTRAAASGRLDPAAVRASCARITALKAELAAGVPLE